MSVTHPGIEAEIPDGSAPCDRPVVDQRARSVFLGVGNPYFPPGRTQVQLWPDGRLEADTFTLEGVQSDATTVEPEEAASLVSAFGEALEQIAGTPCWSREDDEPQYLLELRSPGTAGLRLVVTRRQLDHCGALCMIHDGLARLCEAFPPGRHSL